MSNYSSLKATINANVKTNGNQEITGQVMNAVLNAMVNSLGSGYQYMGIATPTNPGTNQTPDDRCFYIATTPGTYSHLGGLVVNDGEVAILKYDSAWSKEVTGAATAAQVTQLGRDLDGLLVGELEKGSILTSGTSLAGYPRKSAGYNGKLYPSQSRTTYLYDVSNLEYIYVDFTNVDTANNCIAFTNDPALQSAVSYVSFDSASGEMLVPVPAGVTYVALEKSTYAGATQCDAYQAINSPSRIEQIETDIDELQDESDEVLGMDYNGTAASLTDYRVLQVNISSGSRFKLKLTSTAVCSRYIIVYNLSNPKRLLDTTSQDVGEAWHEYVAPEAITYIGIYCISGNTPTISLSCHTFGDVDNIKHDVNFIRGYNVLYGKKWAIVGDSFSCNADSPLTDDSYIKDGNYKGQTINYSRVIANRNDMVLSEFNAGGRTLAYPSDHTFDNAFAKPSVYQSVPNDCDYITISLGINDRSHYEGYSPDGESTAGAISLGDIDSVDTGTFYGAWNVVLQYLINLNPFAKIAIIIPPLGGGDNTIPNGALLFYNAEKEIAEKWGLPYLDLNGDDRCPAMHRSIHIGTANAIRISAFTQGANGTHPNSKAYIYESTFIEDFLRSL